MASAEQRPDDDDDVYPIAAGQRSFVTPELRTFIDRVIVPAIVEQLIRNRPQNQSIGVELPKSTAPA